MNRSTLLVALTFSVGTIAAEAQSAKLPELRPLTKV
ncbi:MAG: hypothetical protein RI891_189, partial [Gemmatimonadota bacterium]